MFKKNSLLDEFEEQFESRAWEVFTLKIGATVEVYCLSGEGLGWGTYMGDVPVEDVVAELDGPLGENEEYDVMIQTMIREGELFTKIILYTGEIVYGPECDWRSVDEASSSIH